MIVYNTQWLDAVAVKGQARKWYINGLLSGTQLRTIQENYESPFYTPNIFVRIGLAVFCWILVSSVFGLFGMAIIDSIESKTGTGIICLFFSAALFVILEYFIKAKRFYQAGIDDALLYMALTLAVIGMGLLFSPFFNDFEALYALLALPILVVAAIRYTDTVVTAFSFACVVIILFLFFKESILLAKLLPLMCMLLSAGVYILVKKNTKREELRFWADCLLVLEACSLLLFYISGNYFVVEELGNSLFPGFHMPLSFLFWLFTAITPLAYMYVGLKNLDRLLLRVGLLMIAISVITFKYYFSVGHMEVTLTIAGTLLVALAYGCIRYLKNNPGQFTYAEDSTDENASFENTEAVLIAQTAGAPAVAGNTFDFGGGKFGGGGAGGNY